MKCPRCERTFKVEDLKVKHLEVNLNQMFFDCPDPCYTQGFIIYRLVGANMIIEDCLVHGDCDEQTEQRVLDLVKNNK